MAKVKESSDQVTLHTVPLNWSEVYYTNCPLVSASNVDQELGWTQEEHKKFGVRYVFMRSIRGNDWWRIQEEQGIELMLRVH